MQWRSLVPVAVVAAVLGCAASVGIVSPFDFGFPQEQRGEATGSGFVTDKDGTILTNAHVVAGASRVTVQFADKRVREAKILGRDDSTDLAVLKVDAPANELTPLTLGSSAGVQVGDPTI